MDSTFLRDHDARHLVARWLDAQAEQQRLVSVLIRSVLVLLGAGLVNAALRALIAWGVWWLEPFLYLIYLLYVLMAAAVLVDLVLLARTTVRMGLLRRAYRRL